MRFLDTKDCGRQGVLYQLDWSSSLMRTTDWVLNHENRLRRFFHPMIHALVTAEFLFGLKWHYEVFRWFDLYVRKGDAACGGTT